MARAVTMAAAVLIVPLVVAACIRVGEPLHVVALVGDRELSASLSSRQIPLSEQLQRQGLSQQSADLFFDPPLK